MIQAQWPALAQEAAKSEASFADFLERVLACEQAARQERKRATLLKFAGMPAIKTLEQFDWAAGSGAPKAQLQELAHLAFIERAENVVLLGPSGVGKTHLVAAIADALIDLGYRVLFTRTGDLVQRLQAAHAQLRLPAELAKLDRVDLLILDDFSYVRRDQAETSVLFELIAQRYERRSIALTANAPFSAWEQVFPDKAMTLAAIDRLVHHATILEMNTDSYRRRAAQPASGLGCATKTQ